MPSQRQPADERERHAFSQRSEPLRREIRLHCYRMMGSLHEAEDQVQETYLRAWRGFAGFAGGSFRAWLYRIATNTCLNALARRKHSHRLLPDQFAPASTDVPPGAPDAEVAWLEPYPDADLDEVVQRAPDPEARYSSRQAVRLAFVAAIQELPPRQRAALILCDVLGWAAAEAAGALGGSTAAINSALQRARETLSRRHPPGQASEAPPPDAAQARLLGRYLAAWEGHDLDGFVALLREDASAIMPPWREWYAGRAAIRSFFAAAWRTCGGLRLVPTAANGQPAFAVYEQSSADGRWLAHSLHVLTIEAEAIVGMTLFVEPHLFAAFGLPAVLPARSA